MGTIYYKGEQYIEPPPIIANAIMLTEEEANKYNIILNDADEEEVVAYGGERVFLGDPYNDFICHGIKIVQAENDEAFWAKIQPSHAYTSIAASDIELSSLGTVHFFKGSSGGTGSLLNLRAELNATTITISGTVNTYSRFLTYTFTNRPFAFGIVFRAKTYNSSGVYWEAHLVLWTKENDEYIISEHTPLATSAGTELYHQDSSPNISWGSAAEYDYACGIKGKFSYVTEEQFNEALEAAGYSTP